jgi:hypothetical protein
MKKLVSRKMSFIARPESVIIRLAVFLLSLKQVFHKMVVDLFHCHTVIEFMNMIGASVPIVWEKTVKELDIILNLLMNGQACSNISLMTN